MHKLALALLTAVFLSNQPLAQQPPAPQELGPALRAGGLVIVLRHGATHADQADTDPLNHANVERQRHLNDAGRNEATEFGKLLKRSSVPIGQVYSSRFQRAVDTARLIAGKDPLTTLDVTEGGLVVTPTENARRAGALRKLAATMPEAGTNTLIVTHKPNIVDAFGKEWFEIKEGEASIFRPGGDGKYALVRRVQMAQWADVLR